MQIIIILYPLNNYKVRFTVSHSTVTLEIKAFWWAHTSTSLRPVRSVVDTGWWFFDVDWSSHHIVVAIVLFCRNVLSISPLWRLWVSWTESFGKITFLQVTVILFRWESYEDRTKRWRGLLSLLRLSVVSSLLHLHIAQPSHCIEDIWDYSYRA